MFFTVAYTIMCLVFVLLLAVWLRAELGIKTKPLTAGWLWLAGAVGLEIVAGVVSMLFDPMRLGNVLLHAIGGGVVSTMLFFYLYDMFYVRTSWRLQAVLLFCFVATLGVLNELAEFAMELAHFGIFSYDSQDTWRDFVANTSGALLLWLLVRAGGYIACRTARRPAGRTIQ